MQTSTIEALKTYKSVCEALDTLDDTPAAFGILTWLLGAIGAATDMTDEEFGAKVAQYVADAMNIQRGKITAQDMKP